MAHFKSNDLFNGFLATPITYSPGESTKVFVDEPTPAQSVTGSLALRGWAIDNDDAVISVSLQIDGSPVGAAYYGTSRPDVCAVYPNQTTCPNVGWTASVDTTHFSAGAHTLSAIATSADGHHATASVKFNVLSPADVPNPIKLFVDQPSAKSGPLSGVSQISGWAIDSSRNISQVEIEVDPKIGIYGPYPYTATCGSSRPDVCSAYPTTLSCPNVGWNLQLDTSTLSNGTHAMLVTAYASDGSQNSTTASFVVENNSPIKTFIDQPNTNTASLSGQTVFSGWALDPAKMISNIGLLIDGSSYYGNNVCPVRGFRADVCAVYQSPDCPNVGWSFRFDTAQLANGPHTLSIMAQTIGYPYEQTTSSPISFTVSNKAAPSTTRLFIDQPASSSAVLDDLASISGWAIDDASGISQVQIFVDGEPAGSVGTYVNRPDVCAVYSNHPGCPYVGWTSSLDTYRLTNGIHTLSATAVSYLGSRATVAQSFTVSNSTIGNSTRLYIDEPVSESQPLSGTTTLRGWALNDLQTIRDVEILIDGSSLGFATYGTPRQDVCNTYPGRPDCPNAGWAYTLDTGQLSNGTHVLEVRARANSFNEQDSQYAVESTFFTVQNSAPASIRAYIDHPSSGSTALSGISSIAGWALYDYGAVQDVTIAVDNVPFGIATYGLSRGDVCAAYPGKTGCPDVGWAFTLDTTLLGNGKHEAEITITTADGLNETLTRSFSVSN